MTLFIEIEDITRKELIINLDCIESIEKNKELYFLFLQSNTYGIQISFETYLWITEYLRGNDLLG